MKKKLAQIYDISVAFRAGARGSLAPIFALTIFCIVALAGAAIALGMDSKAANNLQAAADSSALAGATAFINATSARLEDRKEEAVLLATAAAQNNADYALTRMDVGQIVEDAYGQKTEVTVDLSFEPVNPASKMVGRNANVSINRSATASAVWGFPLCILALSTSDVGLSTAGASEVLAENCVIWSNSSRSNSMTFSGGEAETKYFCSAGGASVDSAARVTPRPTEDCRPIPDPMEDWVPPAAGMAKIVPELEMASPDKTLAFAAQVFRGVIQKTQEKTGTSTAEALASVTLSIETSPLNLLSGDGTFAWGPAKGLTPAELLQLSGLIDNVDKADYASDSYADTPTLTLSPNTFNGLDISEGHIRFQPGVYHIVDAPLIVRRRATLSGEGVTIILHGENATFSVLDDARLTLSAPTEGDTAGIALAEDRYKSLKSNDSLRSRLTGSGKVDAIGTVYLPRQILSITGAGSADQTSPLLQIVANQVELAESGGLKIKIDTSKTDVPMRIKPERTARLER